MGYTPIGVWSLCISQDYRTAPVPSPIGSSEAITAVSGFDMENNLPWCGLGSGKIVGSKPKGKSYKKAIYCDGSVNDPAACAALHTSNGATNNINTLFDRVTPIYCIGACRSDCTQYDMTQNDAKFPQQGISQCANIASRMIQKEALHHGQAGYWVSIVVVQWADLLICKTRWLSIRAQGLRSSTHGSATARSSLRVSARARSASRTGCRASRGRSSSLCTTSAASTSCARPRPR